MSEEVVQFSCSICGSNLKVSPEDIISTCKYCGGINIVSGIIDREDVFIIPSVDEGRVVEEFWKRVRGDLDLKKIVEKIKISSIQGWYIPFWITRVYLDGMIIYTKKEYRGKNVKLVKKKERFSEVVDVDVIGRRQVKNIGLRELVKAYLKSGIKAVEIGKLEENWWRLNKLKMLNIEFDRDEASIMLREEAVDFARKKWESMIDKIEFFEAEVKSMEKPRLILLPLWEVVYEYSGSLYFAIHEGWRGMPIVFAEPISIGRRTLYLIGMISSILGGVSIGSILSLTPLNDVNDILIIIMLSLFLLVLIGYRSAKKFVSDVRVEKIWK
ncbi:MAG: hypothetical protein RMI88_01395 [Nitrososphaerota archaeon]|nr:hypothetical protein [Nitrososphaerota archaeon]